MIKVKNNSSSKIRTASLVPGGIMQFLDINLDVKKIKKLNNEYYEYVCNDELNGKELAGFVSLEKTHDGTGYLDTVTGEPWINPITKELTPELQPSYSVSIERALEPFLDQWVPLPFFRMLGEVGIDQSRYRFGPTDWARIRVTAIEDQNSAGNTHRLTIAFDTQVSQDVDVPNISESDGYPAIAQMDVNEGAEYALVTEFKNVVWYLKLEWVKSWLKDLFYEFLKSKNPNRKFKETELEFRNEYLSRYLAFLELLNISNLIPRVRLIDPSRTATPIDVDLVLDIGNSRTIGMLIEKREGEILSLDHGAILELRDLSRPNRIYRETFSSHICFSKGTFGNSTYSRASGRSTSSFTWPSAVRVGNEAAYLAAQSKRQQGQTSNSSPKRYLWDQRPAKQEWRYAPDHSDPTSKESPVNSGDFVGFINNFGTPLHTFESSRFSATDYLAGQPQDPVTEPLFSRSSLMMFLLSEIITHALVQINSPAQRADRGLADIPRRLRRIIITAPPAMSMSERIIYKRWAVWAVEVLWRSLNWSEHSNNSRDYRLRPVIKMDLDEASATQLVFVYNEIERKFSGDAQEYFRLYGRHRKQYGANSSLRIASIDIGGGTTDMVITTYINEQVNATNKIIPRQEFREGFNFAGDDILKVLIESHILPQLKKFIATHIPAQINDYMHRKFAQGAVGLPESEKNGRVQFTKQILVPIALILMRRIEQLTNEESYNFVLSMPFSDFFPEQDSFDVSILDYLQYPVGWSNTNIDLSTWTPSFNLGQVSASLTSAINPYLQDLCEIIKLWNCDFLVLSGRPSCLPPIHSLLYRTPPVLPSRIIPMSEYRVDKWYPFWTTPDGRISDPKTTGVVGALLSAVSEGSLKNFYFQSSALNPASTIRFVGTMRNNRQILDENLLFDGQDVGKIHDEELNCVMEFQTTTHIGFRQMQTSRWNPTPFYLLSTANYQARVKVDLRGPYKIHFAYKRKFDSDGELDDRIENEGILKISEILDKDGLSIAKNDIVLQLQSLWDDTHWLDTGLFDIQ